ncbi:ATP-dependent Clp protease ATP-binding subunit ClpA [Clostridium omnivorum]|uniref:ATP-dependent Clp protease ATP-binding subunit ClpA n=1 Tax=Clostridium omnivorum TaxID=1604902 RepID=A0ABQ5N100_9CLOT|nr:ATP-dependent Clp protease ATP-binding subunit ClpA [Clostridium sp. E14]GLC28851.1 ATP-dependent Clp protease ATP-binding subunit ClpA [Clostridium sp. E14]
MQIDILLNEIVAAAYSEAKASKHEYLTPEHILYASLFLKESCKIITDCGIDTEILIEDLSSYFKDNINIVNDREPVQTLGVQNILSSAAEHVLSCGKDIIKFEDFLVAVYDYEEGFGSYFLKKQGISRLDILKSITIKYDAEDDYKEEKIEKGEIEEDAKEQGILEKYTVELTKKAMNGEIDPLIGREDILQRTIQTLCRRMKNNPIHIGEPGVGKTAITEGIAALIAKNQVPDLLKGFRIYSLDMGAILAGTKYRGDFEERIKKVLNEIMKEEKAIVYIDEIHTVIGAGAISGGAMDASNILKPFIDRGRLRVVGSTTFEEYKKIFEKDRALSRRFQKIEVNEPTELEAYEILLGLRKNYEEFHRVEYTDGALKAAVELSAKYIQDRFLPDKAIDVIDEAGAIAAISRDDKEKVIISANEIEKVVAVMGKVPEESVSSNELEKLRKLEGELKSQIFGQDKAIHDIVDAIKRSRAGFNEGDKPVASLLFVGPTGVGKTEIARQLSKTLGISLVRFDMSEYQEKHSVARLIGSPPGYVGYEEGGLLTEAIRKTPNCVLLLDEIEKAHADILNVLLQVMDYATLTDNTGKKADFKSVILIMTSNAGAREIGKPIIGFGGREHSSVAINEEVERVFSPEFRNRLDGILIFNKLDKDMSIKVTKKALHRFEEQLIAKKIKLLVTEQCINYISEKGINSNYGAREIYRVVQQEIKPYFVDEVLFGKLSNGGTALIDLIGKEIVINIK